MMSEAFKRWCGPPDVSRSEAKGAGACCAAAEAKEQARPQSGDAPAKDAPPKLEDLIPIAVVITAGCEECAERNVRRAIEAGSVPRHVLRTIAIVADLRERECFRAKIAPEVVERMKGPLEKARRTLDELTAAGGASARPSGV